MYRSSMDGSNIEVLLNTSVDVVGRYTHEVFVSVSKEYYLSVCTCIHGLSR